MTAQLSESQIPEDYIPRFTEEEVKRRIVYLAERAFVFLKAVKDRYPRWTLNFDPLVMVNVGQSAMDDIWRYKVFHLRSRAKRSDAIKRAAYFTKWIVKLRPIYFESRPLTYDQFASSFDPNDSTLLINEAFALHIALATLATDAKVGVIALTYELLANLLYDLHFRSMTEDALMEIYSMVRMRAKGQDIIVK